MPPITRYVMASYARADVEAVRPIVRAIQTAYDFLQLNVHVWIDLDQLRPGQVWESEIERVLRDCIGLLVFVSPAAMQSDWVRRELEAALVRRERLILPVILSAVMELPPDLARIQWVDLSGDRSDEALVAAARQIADATKRYLSSQIAVPPIPAIEAPSVAARIAKEARGGPQAGIPEPGVPDSVFVVHGHHVSSLNEVDAYLTELGIKTIVLSRIAGPAQSLFQKFLSSSTSARFAIVILTADDMGASLIQYDAAGVGEKALQFRARQNVILELGFFYGYLGWEHVFVVFLNPDRVFPNFERPSDLEGVIFDAIDVTGSWRNSLAEKLVEAGFKLKKSV